MPDPTLNRNPSLLDRVIRFSLEQKLVVVIIAVLLAGWGIAVAPFDWDLEWLPRDPVAVDAIPDLGENQQIVFTEWPGRSPRDVEDQVTYPLSVALMGVAGVEEVRSQSMFGFSSINVIFDENIEFYWARSRLLEKLNALPPDLLPDDARPALGPDATALGQIFWYTLEGRDPQGDPIGGWDLHELRSVQDWVVRYGLAASEGVAEVASIGGYVREYQVDVDPNAMRAHGVTLAEVADAVGRSNLEVGAATTEINRVEYFVRGTGYIQTVSDIENAVLRRNTAGVPLRIDDVAHVTLGPAERRGALTVAGAEAVGGVVVVREGYNPLAAINNVRERIDEISPGLPARVVIDWSQASRDDVDAFARLWGFDAYTEDGDLDHEAWTTWLRAHDRSLWPDWATLSQLEIVPFYDRTDLIYETLGTLNDALVQQILVTVIVVIVLVIHLRASLLISGMLPMAVLLCFIAMKLAGVQANVVALAGIAIAIGTIVDMGLIISENVLRHLEEADEDEDRLEVVYRGTTEVGSAVLTAILTTVVSFLPVFALTGAAGKMFTPLAYTKTFVLIAAIGIALTIIPAAAHTIIAARVSRTRARQALWGVVGVAALVLTVVAAARGWAIVWPVALAAAAIAAYHVLADALLVGRAARWRRAGPWVINAIAAAGVLWVLAQVWEPLGPEVGLERNMIFVGLLIGSVLGVFALVIWAYEWILRWCLAHKLLFLSLPMLMILAGLAVWLGFEFMMLWAMPVAAVLAVLGVGYAGWMLAAWAHEQLGLDLSRWTVRSLAVAWAGVVACGVGGVAWGAVWFHANIEALHEGETAIWSVADVVMRWGPPVLLLIGTTIGAVGVVLFVQSLRQRSRIAFEAGDWMMFGIGTGLLAGGAAGTWVWWYFGTVALGVITGLGVAVVIAVPIAFFAWIGVAAIGWATLVGAISLSTLVWLSVLDTYELDAHTGWTWAAAEWPALPYDDQPAFDEGSFLWMPTTSYHASIGEALDVLTHQDRAIAGVPEIETVVGKIGRVESALDPAPVGMIETVIHYKSEYVTDDAGRRINFRYNDQTGQFARDDQGDLIPDPAGRPCRQWRDHIHSPADIWDALAQAADLPGTTSAPPLQPIETRQVMLQTGMRATMGVKVRAADLNDLDRAVREIESVLDGVPGINPATISAERVVGKPYLEVEIDREAAARHGLNVADINEIVATAIGGRTVTRTVEGRERYDVRVRYPRELRNDIEAMETVLIDTPALDAQPDPGTLLAALEESSGTTTGPIRLGDVAQITYTRGPQMIRSEDTFPVAYVTFGATAGTPAMQVIDNARQLLADHVRSGQITLPTGASYSFAGEFENQAQMMRTLSVVIPISLAIILLLLYLQFRSLLTAGIVFSGIAVAWAGGFVMIYLYGQQWFGDFAVFGVNMRQLFQLEPIHLTGAVWVGFLALFGIAVDDGVVMSTYLNQSFDRRKPATVAAIREATIVAGKRRVRPCLMTSATTILALLPVLTLTGRGADVMIPMAIPSVGGMTFVLITMFTVPVLYCLAAEVRLRTRQALA